MFLFPFPKAHQSLFLSGSEVFELLKPTYIKCTILTTFKHSQHRYTTLLPNPSLPFISRTLFSCKATLHTSRGNSPTLPVDPRSSPSYPNPRGASYKWIHSSFPCVCLSLSMMSSGVHPRHSVCQMSFLIQINETMG